jgi:hypothetical protein
MRVAQKGGMMKKKRFQQALNAAKSVLRGTRKHTVCAVSGVALLTVASGCMNSTTPKNDTLSVDTTTAETVSQDTMQAKLDAILDTLAPEVLADTMAKVDTTKPADTATPADAPLTDASPVDATPVDGEADAGACLEHCYQPTDKTCTDYKDCEVAEMVPGTCEGTEDPCAPGMPCPDGVVCEGYEGIVQAVVDPDGTVAFWSPVNCIDGLCHLGQGAGLTEAQNQAAHNCCSGEGWDNLCPGVDMLAGCSPWGPAAPVPHDMERVRALLKAVA